MDRSRAEKAKTAKAAQTKAKAAKVRAKLNEDRARARQGAAEAQGNASDVDTGGPEGMSDGEQAHVAEREGLSGPYTRMAERGSLS